MVEWLMMAAFAAALGLSVWKLYAFLPTKALADDDTTPAAQEVLHTLMLCCAAELAACDEAPTPERLYAAMIAHERFDAERFWRFNPNKLNNLITRHRLRNPHIKDLAHLCEEARRNTTPAT